MRMQLSTDILSLITAAMAVFWGLLPAWALGIVITVSQILS